MVSISFSGRAVSCSGIALAAFRPEAGLEILQQLAGAPALAAVAALQRLQDADEVFVADALQLADRAALGLLVGLLADLFDQRVVEIDNIGELRPGPGEAGAELGEEMPHARFAAGDPVGLEQAHLRPAQAEGIADDVVQRLDGADIVLDQPERLAPQGFQQAVADEGLDLAGDVDTLHADGYQPVHGGLDRLRRCLGATDDLHQRQEIDGIVGVGDEQPLGMIHVTLQVRWQQARGGGTDQGIRLCGRIDLVEHAALQVEPLGHAFLDPVGICHRLFQAGAEGELAAWRQRCAGQHAVGALGIGQHFADDALRFRMRIEDLDVDAGQQEAGNPPPADNAAADAGGL
ncbi:MAG: hypothetical protein PW844_15440 [Pantoea sp.]|nr:hypothetical protein [Pantoea sp.]MDE1187855.1 hypothetical protein [Pantoea sp.]